MRRLALAALSIGLAACGPTLAATAQPPHARATSAAEAQLFSLDKGFMFPLANGGRVPIENGWIEPHFSPFPPQRDADVDIVVGTDSGRASDADVTVSYEMLEMAHGATTVRGDPAAGGHHHVHMAMGMYGTWQMKVHVVLDGVTSTSVIVLSGAGQ